MRVGFDATAVPDRPVGAGNYIVELAKALAASGSDAHITVFHRRSAFDFFYRSWQRLIWEQTMLPSQVRRHNLDILHSPHYTMPTRSTSKSVVTFHDCTFFLYPEFHTLPKRFFFRNMMKISAKRSDAIIAVSESTRNDAMRLLKVSSEKVWTIPLGVSDAFRPLSEIDGVEQLINKHNLPDEFLLYVGALEPRKNLVSMIEAYELLLEEGYSLDLVMVGPLGWMYQDVLEKISSSDHKSRIHRLGYVSAEELVKIYNLAKALVYIPIYEGFGLPVLEAMSCGTPVLASNTSSIPEIAGNAATLVEPTDVEEIHSAIVSTLSDEHMRERKIREGLKKAAEFTWQRTAESTIAVYESILRDA